MQVTPISKASARQRAGRAGRTKPGKCYRLYTEATFKNELPDNSIPEILRSNLASVVLTLLVLGVNDIVHFDFMDPPAPETLMRAYEVLNYLGAISEEGEITEEGRFMSEFPLDPETSKMLVESPNYNCSADVLSLVAMLSVPNCFLRPKDTATLADQAKAQFSHVDGDHLTLINVYDAYIAEGCSQEWCNENFINHRSLRAAADVRRQLELKMKRLNLPLNSDKKNKSRNVRKCLTIGFFMQVAHQERSNFYMTLREKQVVALHPSTSLCSRPEWALYHELIITSRNYIRTVSPIEPKWLLKVSPQYFHLDNFPDTQGRRELERLVKKSKKRSSR